MTRQIADTLNLVAVPADWTGWMLATIEAEQALDAGEHERQLAALADRLRQVEQKLDRLLAAHLDADITSEEYRSAKGCIVVEIADQTAVLTLNRGKRFEPVTRFVKSLQEATLPASRTDAVAKRDFLKKNGSNPGVCDRELKWELRGAWKIVEKHGPFAHQNNAHSIERVICW